MELDYRIRHAPSMWEDPVVKGPGINYMKRKKASSNYDTTQCKKHTNQRMAFKGTLTIFTVTEYWHKITSKARRSSLKIHPVLLEIIQ
jgi:hypothetical protein